MQRFTKLLKKAAGSFLTIIPICIVSNIAKAESYTNIDNVAFKSAVRIAGSTQGTGVIIDRKGTNYTVLTAWHVIKPNVKGESIDLFIQDNRYSIVANPGINIKRIGNLDMAIIKFSSSRNYLIPRAERSHKRTTGELTAVAGFPSKIRILE